jgi:hypothetical protein
MSDTPKVEGSLLALGMLLLLTLGVSFLPASWLGAKKESAQYPPLNLGALATFDSGASDANGDGITTWKEYITNSLNLPENATTSVETDARSIAQLNDTNNLTSSFTKNLYIASVALKENNITDPAVTQGALDQLVQKEYQKLNEPQYTKSSLKISTDNSPAALKAYGNSLGSILAGLITKDSISSQILSINSFVQSENEGDLLPIVSAALKSETAISKLLELSVPSTAIDVHLHMLNNFSSYATTLDNISKAYDDPLRATFAIHSYIDITLGALKTIGDMDAFLDNKNIVFASKDPGYLFTSYTKASSN